MKNRKINLSIVASVSLSILALVATGITTFAMLQVSKPSLDLGALAGGTITLIAASVVAWIQVRHESARLADTWKMPIYQETIRVMTAIAYWMRKMSQQTLPYPNPKIGLNYLRQVKENKEADAASLHSFEEMTRELDLLSDIRTKLVFIKSFELVDDIDAAETIIRSYVNDSVKGITSSRKRALYVREIERRTLALASKTANELKLSGKSVKTKRALKKEAQEIRTEYFLHQNSQELPDLNDEQFAALQAGQFVFIDNDLALSWLKTPHFRGKIILSRQYEYDLCDLEAGR